MSGKKPTIYLDHAATSKIREQALAAMLPYLSEEFGNPSSLHGPGLSAKKAMQQAASVSFMKGGSVMKSTSFGKSQPMKECLLVTFSPRHSSIS